MPRTIKKTVPTVDLERELNVSPAGSQDRELSLEDVLQEVRAQIQLGVDLLFGLFLVLFSTITSVFLPEALFRLLYAQNPENLNQELFGLIPTISYSFSVIGFAYVIVRIVQAILLRRK